MAKKITLKINDMECPNCAMLLERIEDTLDGVLLAEASYHKAQMVVEYDEKTISEADIQAAIQKMGYEVGAVQR